MSDYWMTLANRRDDQLRAANKRNIRYINACAVLAAWAIIATAVAVVEAILR